MNKTAFLQQAISFKSCGVVVITSGNYQEARSLACDARDAIQQAGGNSLVYDAETLAAHTRDSYASRSLQPWAPDRKFYAGEYVIPTSMHQNDYVVLSRPFDCADSIQQRFRFRCSRAGVSGRTEPAWPAVEGAAADEGAERPRWIAEAFSGRRGTASSESGLVWEWISLISRGSYVVFAPKEFDPRNSLTGNLVTDAILDVAQTERPAFWPYQHLYRRLTRELFPYMSSQYYCDASKDESDGGYVTFIKSQETDGGCAAH
jgi:hypothetical protein